MKLSQKTVDVVKNFSEINKGMLFKSGNVLSIISQQKNVMGKAVIQESFPVQFGIYDLPELLGVFSLFKEEPDIDFQDKQLVIYGQAGRSKITYRYTEQALIVSPDKDSISFPSEDIAFSLSEDDFMWLMRSAAVLKSPQIIVESNGKKVVLVTTDVANDASNIHSLEIGEGNGDIYRIIFKTDNLKFMPDSYDVVITTSNANMNIARFSNKDSSLVYYVTSENGSSFRKGK